MEEDDDEEGDEEEGPSGSVNADGDQVRFVHIPGDCMLDLSRRKSSDAQTTSSESRFSWNTSACL